MRGAAWTTLEDNILIKHYRERGHLSPHPVVPKRSLYAVQKRVGILGLSKFSTHISWTTKEECLLIEHYKEGKDACLDLFPRRTWNSIRIRACRLGLAKPAPLRVMTRRDRWQPQEDEILANCPHDADEASRQLAAAGYSRTTNAIARRRSVLGVHLTPLDGYTALELARLIGSNVTNIYAWEMRGWLVAENDNTRKIWKGPSIKKFLTSHTRLWDIKKVDQYFIVGILSGTL